MTRETEVEKLVKALQGKFTMSPREKAERIYADIEYQVRRSEEKKMVKFFNDFEKWVYDHRFIWDEQHKDYPLLEEIWINDYIKQKKKELGL
jgi:hypothetical protein